MNHLMSVAIGAAALLFAPSASAAERCNAGTVVNWDAAGAGVTVEAFASGTACEKATAVVVFRNAEGVPQKWDTIPAEQNMMLAGKTNAAELDAALKELLDQKSSPYATTGDLPEWKAGENFPINGEFVFYVDETIDRKNYARIRAAKAPVFCYVLGMESQACVYKEPTDGNLTHIGFQSFPG